jgi:hypothetical protein
MLLENQLNPNLGMHFDHLKITVCRDANQVDRNEQQYSIRAATW